MTIRGTEHSKPVPRFRGSFDTPGRDSSVNDGRNALTHSRNIAQYVGADTEYTRTQKQIEDHKAAGLDKLKDSVFRTSSCLGILTGLIGVFAGYQAVSHVQQAKAILNGREIGELSHEEHMAFRSVVLPTHGWVPLTVVGSIASLILLAKSQSFQNVGEALGHFKKVIEDLKVARKFKKTSLPLIPEQDTLNARFVTILQSGIRETADQLATQIRNDVLSNPYIQTYYSNIFGNTNQISGRDLEQLFEYYAYLQHVGNLSASGKGTIQPLSELEFRKSVYSMMQVTLKTGDLFDFVRSNESIKSKPTPFGFTDQVFNRVLQEHVNTMAMQVECQMDLIRELAQREQELGNYILLGQKTMAVLALRERGGNTPAQTELQQLLDESKQRRQNLQESLKFDGNRMKLDDSQLAEMNTSLQDFIQRFRSAVTLDSFLADIDAHKSDALNGASGESDFQKQLAAAINSTSGSSLHVAS